MKNKLLAFVLFLMLFIVMLTIAVGAEEVVFEKMDNQLIITVYYEDDPSHLTLSIDGYGNGRTNIANLVSQYRDAIVEVVIGDEVKFIPGSFNAFTNLKQATLGKSMETISDAMFRNCRNLISVNIPYGVTTIKNNAFQGCTSLSGIDIPGSVTTVGNSAFSNCTTLSYVNISEGVNSIGAYAFSSCRNLISVNIPYGVTTIKNNAFQGCTSLSGIDIPGSVTTVGDNAFSNCTTLSCVNIPEGVNSIGAYAFSNCRKLSKIILPTTLTTIGANSFENCSILESIELYESVYSVGAYAFRGCSKLTIYVSSNCNIDSWDPMWNTSNRPVEGLLGEHQHSYTSKITKEPTHNEQGERTYTCECGDSYTESITKIPHSYTSSVTKEPTHNEQGERTYVCECGDSYTAVEPTVPHSYNVTVKRAPTHKLTGITIYSCDCGYSFEEITATIPHEFNEDKVCECGEEWHPEYIEIWNLSATSRDDVVAFLYESYEHPGLFELEISGTGNMRNVMYWIDYSECIVSVVIKDGVIWNMPSGAFARYPRLESVSLGNGITRIPGSAFRECYMLREVKLGEHIKIIERDAFNNCGTLETIECKGSVDRIAYMAFQGCINLRTFEARHIQRIENAAFRGCESLEYVNAEAIFYIGRDAFSFCRKLKCVNGMEYAEFLGANAFRECIELESIIIGEKITKLEPNVFTNCRNLYNVTIIGYYVTIPRQFFSGCVNLKTVAIFADTIKIEDMAFQSCTSLTMFGVTGDITYIGNGAFQGCRNLQGIDLGKIITYIGNGAFQGCAGLKSVYYDGNVWECQIAPNAFQGCQAFVYVRPGCEFQKIAGIKEVYDECTHEHFTGNNNCIHEHKTSDYAGVEHVIVEPTYTTDGLSVLVCSCGVATAQITSMNHFEHTPIDPNNWEVYDDNYHVQFCECGELINREKHYYTDGVCECGFEKGSIDLDDLNGISIRSDGFYDEEQESEIFERLALLFDKEKESFDKYGYVFEKTGFGLSIALREQIKIRGVNLWVAGGPAMLTVSVTDWEGSTYETNIYVYNSEDGIVPISVSFLGGMDAKFIEIVVIAMETPVYVYETEIALRESDLKYNVADDKVSIEVNIKTDNAAGFEIPESMLDILEGLITEINTEIGQLTLDADAVNKITGKKDKVTIELTDITTDEESILGKKVYDISVNDKHGNPLLPVEESDKNGLLTLSFKYQKGKNENDIKIFYRDENGKRHKVDVEYYNPVTGEVIFHTNHLSVYEIASEEAEMLAITESMFEFIGISDREDGSGGICFSYKINNEAIADYESIWEKTPEIGVVVAMYDQLGGHQPLDQNGNVSQIDGANILKLNLSKDNILCDVVFTDFTEEYYSEAFVVAAYSKTDLGITYYQNENVSNTVLSYVYKPNEETFED